MPIAFQKVLWRDDVVGIRVRQANENSFFSLDSQLNVLHFCLRSVFMFIFQGHVKVALIQLSPVHLLQHSHNCSLSSGDAAVLNKLLKNPLLGGSGVSITRNKEPWFSVSILN